MLLFIEAILQQVEPVSQIVRKDAHDMILDFIRSRPPLLPVSKITSKQPTLRPNPTFVDSLYFAFIKYY